MNNHFALMVANWLLTTLHDIPDNDRNALKDPSRIFTVFLVYVVVILVAFPALIVTATAAYALCTFFAPAAFPDPLTAVLPSWLQSAVLMSAASYTTIMVGLIASEIVVRPGLLLWGHAVALAKIYKYRATALTLICLLIVDHTASPSGLLAVDLLVFVAMILMCWAMVCGARLILLRIEKALRPADVDFGP